MGFTTCRAGRVFAVRWSNTTVEGVERVGAEAKRYQRSLGKKIVYISVTGEDCPPPSEAARTALVEGAKDLASVCERIYVVLEGQGFRGSVLRSVLASLMLLSRMRGTIHVAPSVDEVLAALAGTPGFEDALVRRAFVREGILLSATGTEP